MTDTGDGSAMRGGEWTRRRLLAAGAGCVAAALVRVSAGADAGRVPLVDTHLHCFAGAKDERFPYHAKGPYRPAEPATPEQLLKCMDEAGVGFSVVVHPEPYQDDHRYLEHCLAVGGKRLKGTCLFFAEDADAPRKLAELSKRVPLVAARVHAYVPDRLPPFGKPELRNLWKSAADLGLAVQLHFEPRYAPGFEPLIREFGRTPVFIDHLGRPFQGTPEEHERVIGWSKFPNTIMKLSSIPQKTTYPHRDPATVIKRLTDAYGADRLMYGGGFNAAATGKSYAAAFAEARGYLQHLSKEDQDKVLGGTAARVMGLA